MPSLSHTHLSLLEALRDGRNGQAWRMFDERYRPMLLSFAVNRMNFSREDARDVVAESMVSFIEGYREGRYDREKGRLRDWLKGIVLNKTRQFFARRRMTRDEARSMADEAAERAEAERLADEARLDAGFELEWQLQRLNEALSIYRAEVETETYQALDLYAVKNWPVKKVASFLGVPANVVYLAKSRGIRRLREIVEELAKEETSEVSDV